MGDVTPLERLQPCLLDRLIDDDPQNRQEARNQRVISYPRYRRGVLRDLEWLFNASAFLPVEVGDNIDLRHYPEVQRSVLNYGTRQLYGISAPNLEQLEEELTLAIERFEPRIVPRTLEVRATLDRNLISFEIKGDLWANPVPEHLYIKTSVDLETDQCLLGDATHG